MFRLSWKWRGRSTDKITERTREQTTILRRHLLEKAQISDLCEKKARPDRQAEEERIEYLEKKIQTKDEVLAELMTEHVALKKELGEL